MQLVTVQPSISLLCVMDVESTNELFHSVLEIGVCISTSSLSVQTHHSSELGSHGCPGATLRDRAGSGCSFDRHHTRTAFHVSLTSPGCQAPQRVFQTHFTMVLGR